jgi:hypothetical protein
VDPDLDSMGSLDPDRIGSVFDVVPGSGSGSKGGQKLHTNVEKKFMKKKYRIFMF